MENALYTVRIGEVYSIVRTASVCADCLTARAYRILGPHVDTPLPEEVVGTFEK